MFQWYHAPVDGDRCSSECDVASGAWEAAAAGGDLPCGWAVDEGLPCISPIVVGWKEVAANVGLAGGTGLYVGCFQGWSYRRLFAFAWALQFAIKLLDLLWVFRLNLSVHVPDELFLFGDEVVYQMSRKVLLMPLLIYSAKLCPRGVEASTFALFMGLSNFGYFGSFYVGSGILKAMGGVSPPAFDGLAAYVALRSCMRLLPIPLIPFLVPSGTPQDTAATMGAGAALWDGGMEQLAAAAKSEHGGLADPRTTALEYSASTPLEAPEAEAGEEASNVVIV